MTHYDIHYADEPDADVAAIRDIQNYLTEKQWNALLQRAASSKVSARELALILNFTGVQGFPCHAFIRIFRPSEYQAWYDSLPD